MWEPFSTPSHGAVRANIIRSLALAINSSRITSKLSSFPPVPAFYTRPTSLDDVINHTVGRVLDLFDIEHRDLVQRWQGLSGSTS